jgi:hypothetical protein
MFWGLPDPNPDPLVRYTDPAPDPDPFIIKKNSKKNIDSYCIVTSLCIFIFEKLCKYTFKSNKQNNLKVTDENTWSYKNKIYKINYLIIIFHYAGEDSAVHVQEAQEEPVPGSQPAPREPLNNHQNSCQLHMLTHQKNPSQLTDLKLDNISHFYSIIVSTYLSILISAEQLLACFLLTCCLLQLQLFCLKT